MERARGSSSKDLRPFFNSFRCPSFVAQSSSSPTPQQPYSTRPPTNSRGRSAGQGQSRKWHNNSSNGSDHISQPRPRLNTTLSNDQSLTDPFQELDTRWEQNEPPLDAFDRELLAQLGEQEPESPQEHQLRDASAVGALYEDEATPYVPTSISHDSNETTHSPFFARNSNDTSLTTPLWGRTASPVTKGSNSSPFVQRNEKATRPVPSYLDRPVSHGPGIGVLSQSASSPLFFSSSPTKLNQTSSIPQSRKLMDLDHAPQMIQGVELVSVHELPDRFRSIFPFPVFNAVQSKSFPAIYNQDSNFVLSAPTGSGKTVIMELAICRLLREAKDTQFKVIYQAPTKSLCSERFRDWQKKFSPLNLQCAELTGDTEASQMRHVQSANIIITTPEKWDSMTRKWRDHVKLMQLVRLFLIDEVHILKESRGATLEAVVSRMMSIEANVRFVALSATVPNPEDIAVWLGRDSTNKHIPACRETFGERFRPVKLSKFVYGYQSNANDFAFDKLCESKLPEVIQKHSQRKPILIFCSTRNSSVATAKFLAKLFADTVPSKRLWKAMPNSVRVQDKDLNLTVSSGVAFHHGGLQSSDRVSVEKAFISGHINVICCTSTLAVGVNLPCHLVIIKNTVSWQDNGCRPYPDLEIIQMLGRAGRPQFDDSAVAVILTRKDKVSYYEALASGTEPLESCLHLNIIDHLNAEIGLGTVTDTDSAIKWLTGTFFFVRLRKNPSYYKLKEGADHNDEENLLREICVNDIKALQESSLVTSDGRLKATELGNAMARYYVKYETMNLFLSLPRKAKMSDILSVLSRADEFREVRLKAGEKSLYKEINKGNGIKFPIKIDIALPWHKISLLIQSELGGVEMPTDDQYQKHKLAFQQDKSLVLSHANRLIRCIIDCNISLGDAVTARHALDLARSIGARVWDNTALQLKQLDQIGLVAVRKLANGGINSVETLAASDPHRIEMLLSKNPPFGAKLLAKAAEFPRPRVGVKLLRKDIKHGRPPRVFVQATVGFVNEKAPFFFRRKQIFLCFLAETSDGRLIEFRRSSASKIQNGQGINFSAELTSPSQRINCYAMCDEIAGTLRQAQLEVDIPVSCFPREVEVGKPEILEPKAEKTEDLDDVDLDDLLSDAGDNLANIGKDDIFRDDSLDDMDLFGLVPTPTATKAPSTKKPATPVTDDPVVLGNGKYACNHKCKDKTACKHFCCREGLDRPPKATSKQGDLEDRTSKIAATAHSNTKPPRQSPWDTAKNSQHKKPQPEKIDFIDLSNEDSWTGDMSQRSKTLLEDKFPVRNKPLPKPQLAQKNSEKAELGQSRRVLPVKTAANLDDPSSSFSFLSKQSKAPGPTVPEMSSSPHSDYDSSVIEGWTTPDTNPSPEKPLVQGVEQKEDSINLQCPKEGEPLELDDLMDYVELDDGFSVEQNLVTEKSGNRMGNALTDRNGSCDTKPSIVNDASGPKVQMTKRKYSSYDQNCDAPGEENTLLKKKQTIAEPTKTGTPVPSVIPSDNTKRRLSSPSPSPEPTKTLKHQHPKANERTRHSDGVDSALLEEFGDVADFL